MRQAEEKLNLYCDLLQAIPASWSEHQHASVVVPAATMDFAYDGVYNSFTPSAFPSVLTQTLCELDIDTSIHKLFEGLPEILEETSGHHSAHAAYPAHPATVTVASSPFLSSAHSAQGANRMSAMCASAPQAFGVTSVAAHNATPPATFLRPKPASGQELPPSDHRKSKGGSSQRGTKRPRADAKVPGSEKTPGKKAIDAIVPSIAAPPPPPSSTVHVARMVPKILPIPVNEGHPVHPSLGLGPQAVLRIPKRSRKEALVPPMANTRTQKTSYFDKVEHIVRERWRRDDMAGKFLALESLLPPSSKRDRATIVEDSMKLVKSLQHRKEEALKRRSELKLAVQSPGVKLNRIMQKIGSLAVIPIHGSRNLESSSSPSMVGTKRPLEGCPGTGDSAQIPQLLRDCVKRFYVQSELATEGIVIEMICEQIPNFHSILLKSIETLGLEVLRCSITRTVNKLICNITVKPFPYSASVNWSSTSIMEGLRTVFRKM